MNSRLINYLAKKGAETLDEDLMKEYSTTMKEQTIPDIEKKVRENEERAAELRFSPSPVFRRQKAIAGKKGRHLRGSKQIP